MSCYDVTHGFYGSLDGEEHDIVKYYDLVELNSN